MGKTVLAGKGEGKQENGKWWKRNEEEKQEGNVMECKRREREKTGERGGNERKGHKGKEKQKERKEERKRRVKERDGKEEKRYKKMEGKRKKG